MLRTYQEQGHIRHACGPWMARNAMEPDFSFAPQKVLFPFSECQNWVFFVRKLPKQQIKSWAQHPT
jgi:hypothetical protein